MPQKVPRPRHVEDAHEDARGTVTALRIMLKDVPERVPLEPAHDEA